MSDYKATDEVIKTDCIYCDREPNETAYCNKWYKYLDNGCGECKVVTLADVVEVVRCKDCKYHEELLNNNDENVLCWVHDIDVIVDKNGYCNYGERKEQEHEQGDKSNL